MLFRKHKILIWFKNFFLPFACFLNVYFAHSQFLPENGKEALNYLVSTITTDDLKRHMEVLTSDSLEGRETATPGQKKAANYLRTEFKKMGLLPVSIDGTETYDQVFPIVNTKAREISLAVGDELFFRDSDFIFGGRIEDTAYDTLRIVFAGFGTPEDLARIQCRGGAVMLIHSQAGMNNLAVYNLSDKIDRCRDMGFEYIFIIYGEKDTQFEQLLGISRQYQTGSWLGTQLKEPGIFFISPSLGADIMHKDMDQLLKSAGKSREGKRKPFRKIGETFVVVHAEVYDSLVNTENILGYVRGSEKPEECVIISAHYDHVGIREGDIYRGADDNASGTAALMELAEAFSQAPDPRRSILFIAFTGEEKGLFGSEYYVNHPVFPLSQTLADLNIDMIGRTDSRHPADTGYVYIIGSDKISRELHEISERTNREHTRLVFDYTYNYETDPNRFYYRSDHYNFAKNNIPVIFYFTGVHEDYHKPTDTPDKIRYDRMVTITKLIFYTAWEIANRDDGMD